MKKLILIILTLVPFLTMAQITLIPDPTFEQRLIDLNIDSDGTINGQILTTDAIAVTYLYTGSQYAPIDLTGLNAFVNLETLNCYYTPIDGYTTFTGSIDVSTMLNLKELDVRAANLKSVDVTNNTLLEKMKIGNEYNIGDIWIFNDIVKLDLSSNPKINYVSAYNAFDFTYLNMRNNSADSVSIELGNNLDIPYNVCIEVDDSVAATNNQAPYDTWVVDGNHYYSDNCTLSIEKFVNDNFKIYPNPATEYISIEQKTTDGVTLKSVQILDSSGKWIKSVKENFNQIDVSNLSKGMYLFVIQTDKGNKTEKIIIK